MILNFIRSRIRTQSQLYVNMDGKLCTGKTCKKWVVNGLKQSESNVFRSSRVSEYIVNKIESNDGNTIDFGFNKKYVNQQLGW